ncbi:hypothetical protein SMSP2_02546 [Limihaloglobus sulfuriphilus]|uniref:Uncharacterized protein n=1 Tax=Limihaloglobus sulfuriphilus TaxID=1851148 RepID=A0A1Q2MHH8_9BACT|nr:hypothetical protein [Limihaloglobus sulfuriphilus]AQQ72165.1 hypothetical protein SMSP2_02546 [Limihaloglobus sulfuriphilus]
MKLKAAALILKALILLICWRASELLFEGKYSRECAAAVFIVAAAMASTTVTAAVFDKKNTQLAAMAELFINLTVRFVIVAGGVVVSFSVMELHKGVFVLWLLGLYLFMLITDSTRLYKKHRRGEVFHKDFFEIRGSNGN